MRAIIHLCQKMKISRGSKNNNPLNIRRNGTKWKGLSSKQSDKSFFQFTDSYWGYRAAFITLRNYFLKHGLKTVESWIYRWAPPVENDSDAYLRLVEKRAGVKAGDTPDVFDENVMCRIVAAMSLMENGVPAIMEDVRKGWRTSFL